MSKPKIDQETVLEAIRTARGTLAECCVEGCPRRPVTGRYCRPHAQQLYRNGRITNPVVRAYRQPPTACSIDGCSDRAVVRGLCPAHIQRTYRGRLNPEVPIQRRRQEDK